ncbi:MAG: glycosyltransferase family 1 protein [bacterium]
MKIAIDIRPLGIKRRTGVEEYLLGLLDEFLKIDQENEYILFNNSFLQKNKEFEVYSANPNVKIVNLKIPNKIFNTSLAFLSLPKLDKICGSPDVFFSPNWNFCQISKKTKHILTVHDLSFKISPDFFPFRKRLWHKIIKAQKQAQKTDAIIAVSESTKQDLIEIFKISPEKIKVVYPSIHQRFFKNYSEKEMAETKIKYNLPQNFILFIGTIEPRKGISNLIQAFEVFKETDLRNTYLIIAGIKGWGYGEILKLARKSKFSKFIQLTGFIDDSDKPRLIQLSKLFIYPSFYEGFGFPPLEAMACRVPVITSHNPSLPEISGEASLMINPFRSAEFVWAIKEGLENEKLRRILIEKGEKHIKNFSWEKAARETLKIITS